MDQGSLECRNGESTSSGMAQVTHPAGDSTDQQVGPAAAPSANSRRRALLWSMGGTILSAVGFVALALFEQYNGMVSELRSDLKHFNETSSEFVKKDSLQKIRDKMWDCLKEMQASNVARAQLEQELKASEKARTEMASELQRMRERLAYVEGRQMALPNAGPAASAKK